MRPVRKSPERPIPIVSARDRLPRYDIAITNREAGDEGEIDRVADRPALHKANQQTQGNLNRQNCRQHRPRKMNGVAEGHEKAPPHALWCPTVHAAWAAELTPNMVVLGDPLPGRSARTRSTARLRTDSSFVRVREALSAELGDLLPDFPPVIVRATDAFGCG